METTPYEDMDHNDRTGKKARTYFVALIVVSVIALGLLIGLIVVASSDDSDSSSSGSSGSSSNKYCTTPSCLDLAADIGMSVNDTVEPCDDFYHYVCDGYDASNSWSNLMYPQWGSFMDVSQLEKETFLDALFYRTDPNLVDYTSVEKAQTFYSSCFDSSVDMESYDSEELLMEMITQVSYTNSPSDDSTWSSDDKSGFADALEYLTQSSMMTLFEMTAFTTGGIEFIEQYEFWLYYPYTNWTLLLTESYTPLFIELYNLTDAQAANETTKLIAFMDMLYAYSTSYSYFSSGSIWSDIGFGPITNLSEVFDGNDVMNYTKLILSVYNATAADVLGVVWFKGELDYYRNMSSLIASTSPFTVQLYLLQSVLMNYFDFDSSLQQSRMYQRTDFCFYWTQQRFAFVYGYILVNSIYDNDKYNGIDELVKDIKEGTRDAIDGSDWLDKDSKEAALKKIDYMALYVGFPDQISDGDEVDKYYKSVEMVEGDYVENMAKFTVFNFMQNYGIFYGNAFSMTQGWPTDFNDQGSWDAWLTGINAFYMPTGNWFTIPVTISQKPFYDVDYPSAVNFGGIGGVAGHEMSHGFDPSGSQYDYNGTYVTSIFTDESQEEYADKMTCFTKQYSSIVVDRVNGKDIYDNGTRTITENVADNAGMSSAYKSWKSYVKKNGNDQLLYGIDFNQEQLFFVGWAKLWCEATRPGAYANWTDVHSPNYARVVVPLMNSDEFADAFNCKKGSRMNPKDKCTVW